MATEDGKSTIRELYQTVPHLFEYFLNLEDRDDVLDVAEVVEQDEDPMEIDEDQVQVEIDPRVATLVTKLKRLEVKSVFLLEKDIQRRVGEDLAQFHSRWKRSFLELHSFYNTPGMKRRSWRLKQEKDSLHSKVLQRHIQMAGQKAHERWNGTSLFCFGNAEFGQRGEYSTCMKFVEQGLRELGYPIIYEKETFTSQSEPGVGIKSNCIGRLVSLVVFN